MLYIAQYVLRTIRTKVMTEIQKAEVRRKMYINAITAMTWADTELTDLLLTECQMLFEEKE